MPAEPRLGGAIESPAKGAVANSVMPQLPLVSLLSYVLSQSTFPGFEASTSLPTR